MFQKILKIRGRTHLGMCRQFPPTGQHKNSSIHENDFSQKQKSRSSQSIDNMFASSSTETPPDTEPDWSSGDTALELHFKMKPGKHAFFPEKRAGI